jgi:hypothetical protein
VYGVPAIAVAVSDLRLSVSMVRLPNYSVGTTHLAPIPFFPV